MTSQTATFHPRLSHTMISFTLWATLSIYVILSNILAYAKLIDTWKLIPTKIDNIRERAYINISGAAINLNKTAGFFKINAPQYTSHYKNNRGLSILPMRAHFNSNKYRIKKPIPSNNTYISFEGFLEAIETDSTGHTMSFHVSVDNINFLGRATVMPSGPGNTGITFISVYVSILNTFFQLPQPHPTFRVSNLTSTRPLLAHPLKPPYLNRLLPCLIQKLMYLLGVGSVKNKLICTL